MQTVYVDDITVYISDQEESGCLLGMDQTGYFNGSSYCLLLQILGGITVALGILIGLLQCLTCHLCGLGGIIDGIFGLLGAAAWLAASIVIQDAADDANATDNSIEAERNTNRRDTISIMCWVEFGLFAAVVLSMLFKCCVR